MGKTQEGLRLFPSSLAGGGNEIRQYVVKKDKVGSVSFVTEFLD